MCFSRLLLSNTLSILTSELRSLRDGKTAEEILCRIESLYSNAIDIDLNGLEIPGIFLEMV